MATAATIYMSLLGPEGMQRTASLCHDNAKKLCEKLSQIQGVEKVFSAPFFHEFVLKLSKPVDVVLAKLAEAGIQGGYDLSGAYPKLGNAILICATETKTADDLNRYSETLQQILRG
jgi:glycine dehydrogenase subunit 1